MGTKERREREKDTTREKILSAARDLFARDGYEAVSMRKIAEAIEYSPTAIYVHFQDKQSLLHDLCSADFAKLGAAFEKLARIADPIERIRQSGRTYVRFAVENPNHYRLMFMTARAPESPEVASESVDDPDCSAFHFLRNAVAEAIAAGRFVRGVDDADLLACTFWATVHGVASLTIVKSKETWMKWPDIEALTFLTTDAILRGVLARPAELPIELVHQQEAK
jgi:AcrR family transcriptional regulator